MRLTGDIHDADGIVEVTQALGNLTAYMATIYRYGVTFNRPKSISCQC